MVWRILWKTSMVEINLVNLPEYRLWLKLSSKQCFRKKFIVYQQNLEPPPATLFKTNPTTEVFLHGFYEIALFKFDKIFARYLCHLGISTCRLQLSWKWLISQKDSDLKFKSKDNVRPWLINPSVMYIHVLTIFVR